MTIAEVPQSICMQVYLEDLAWYQIDAGVTFGVCIFDSLTGGNQVCPTQPAPYPSTPTVVSDGSFTMCLGEPSDPPITLDEFGATGSGPQSCWFEISAGG